MEVNYKTILKKGANSLFIQIASIFITIVLHWYLARILGAANYGIFTYAFSWVFFLGSLSTMGLSSVLVREVIKYKTAKKTGYIHGLYNFSSISNLFITLIISLFFVLIVSIFVKDKNIANALLLAIIALPIYGQLLIMQSSHLGFLKVENSLIPYEIIRPLLMIIFIFFFVNFVQKNITVNKTIILNIISILFVIIISYLLLKKSLNFVKSKALYKNKQWLKYGFAFFLITVTTTINTRADILMLGMFGYAEKVGVYNIAVKFSQFIIIPLFISNKVIAPYISELSVSRKKELSKLIKKMTRLVFFMGTIILLMIITLGEYVLDYFGKGFDYGYISMLILGTGQIISVFFGPGNHILSMSKFEKTVLLGTISSTIINLLLNLILIPYFDITGAAIATSVSNVFLSITLFILVSNKLGFNSSIL